MRIIGIDPGFKGGLALFDGKECLECFKMPIKEVKERKNIDGSIIAKYLSVNKVDKAYIEFVHSMPGQGISSAFYFGRGVGIIVGACEAIGVEVVEISPPKWKKKILGEEYTHLDKSGSIDFCKNNFPKLNLMATKRSKVEHDGMADAICIGYYGVLEHQNI